LWRNVIFFVKFCNFPGKAHVFTIMTRCSLAVFAVLVFASDSLLAQIKKQFSVSGERKVEHVALHFEVNNGQCSIKAGESEELITVYSNQDYDNYSHTFNKSIEGKTCKVNLELEDDRAEGFGQTISSRVFGNRHEGTDKIWRVYLNKKQSYDLDLNYGIGQADIDLSGIGVKNLKIHTGSADINIGYFSQEGNTVEMDTFYVKVDMGSVAVRKLDLARSKYVKADVGFGDLLLDITGEEQMSGEVIGSVGAGNMFVILPANSAPTMIKIKDSWLCKVRLPSTFTKSAPNTYVNAAYEADSHEALVFHLDVSMGKIIFKQR